MSQLRVHALTMSLDGYVAGPDQSLDKPLGVGGEACTSGCSRPARWHADVGGPVGRAGVDDRFVAVGFEGIGAYDHGPQHVRPDPRDRGTRRGPAGTAGGVTSRRTTTRCSCSRTTRASRSRWRAARRSTS